MPEKRYPSLPRFNPTVFDSTTIKIAKECMRKYFYRIVLGRRPQASVYQTIFDFGSAYHKFREVLELSHMDGDSNEVAFGKAVQAMSKLPLTAGTGKYEYLTRQRLLQSCIVSFEWWKNEKAKGRIEVIAVEQPFNIALPNGKFIGGRADQIIKWNGKIWGRDFKTTSKRLDYFKASLDPNDQATRYVYMESKLHFGDNAINEGRMVEGIIFEVLQNMSSVLPKIENVPITKNQFQMEDWQRTEMFWHEIIDMCADRDYYPLSETSCSFCDYRKVCQKPSESSQEYTLKNDYILSPWDFNKVDQVTIEEA